MFPLLFPSVLLILSSNPGPARSITAWHKCSSVSVCVGVCVCVAKDEGALIISWFKERKIKGMWGEGRKAETLKNENEKIHDTKKTLWKLERKKKKWGLWISPSCFIHSLCMETTRGPLKMNEIQDLNTIKCTTAVWLSRKELRSTCGFTGVFSIHLWHKHTHTHTHWNSLTQAKPQHTKSSYARVAELKWVSFQ